MDNEKLYDISEICKMFGTTSRTLRYYEEKGLIENTAIGLSNRRKYTGGQLENIKNVLTLRSMGLSVKSILAYQRTNSDLREIVYSKRAEIYAAIDTKIREINLLNEVLFAIDSGVTDISKLIPTAHDASGKELTIVCECTNAILNGNTEALYGYFSEKMKQYLPESAFEKIKRDTFLPLGEYIQTEKAEMDPNYPHRYYQYVRFSKHGLKITFVIYNGKIEGLWLGYYEPDERRKNEKE